MKTTMTNNRKFLKIFFLAIALTAFSGMKAQSASGWTQSGTTGQTVSTKSKDVIICEFANSPTSTISMYGNSGDVKLYNNYGSCELRTPADENIFLNTNLVGIGTTNPTHKLTVNGSVRAITAIIGADTDSAFFGNINALNNAGLIDKNYSLKQGVNGGSYLNASTGTNVHLAVNDVPEVIVSAADTKILNNLIVEGGGLFGANNHIKGTTSFGAEKMPLFAGATVSIDGRLLISDTDAAHNTFTALASANYKDYLLWVQEGIVATDFAITTLSQWPDYVFNKEYKLNTLNEVAEFIKTNGHLPTMPSAKEIEEKGFTVSDITKRTVKTVEELTLHTIEQQKLIENQAQSIQNQAQLIESLTKRLNLLEAKQ